VRRALVLFPLVLALAWPAAAAGATKTYSSGRLAAAIPDGGRVERSLVVRDEGPISGVAVYVRLAHPRDRDLTLSLVGPSGEEVLLAAGRGGEGRDFGRGRPNCAGTFTVFLDNLDLSIREGRAPFADAYSPERPLSALNGEEAQGRWALRIADGAAEASGTLFCWKLEVSRNVVEVVRSRRGGVTAEFRYRRDPDGVYRDTRIRILRAGKVSLDRPVRRLGCATCPTWRPVEAPIVRNLDGEGEPEVVFDFYSGGAHCCTYTLVYGYRPSARRYRQTLHEWGNVGYRFGDPDRDGRPEFLSADDRFAYAFAAYAASFEPIQIWRYQAGRMVDVTRRFPRLVARDAASHWRAYSKETRRGRTDARGLLPAYLADEIMLGRAERGWSRLELAFRRGDLGRTATKDGYPAGRRYLAALRRYLRRTGYLR
jgi:subtilisin-like proprotein convertase family protein